MQRYFIDNPITDETTEVTLTGNDHHHISRVMRMTPNQKIYIVGSNHQAAILQITAISEEEVIGEIVDLVTTDVELPVEVILYIGLPKGDKLELIAQKATELGVTAIVPVTTKHAITKWDNKKATKKIARLQKICQAAAEQSHRTVVPYVYGLHSLKDVVERVDDHEHFVVAYEETAKSGEHKLLKNMLMEIYMGDSIGAFFGPEGGIHPEEVNQLLNAGDHVKTCSLGPRILRAETAPLYLLSAISYATEL